MQTSLLTFFSILSLSSTNAFHVSILKKNAFQVARRRHQPLKGMILPESGDEFDPSDGDAFDVEAVRQKLESLVGGGEEGSERVREDTQQPTMFKPGQQQSMSYLDYTPSKHEVSLPPAPPLTSIGRERLEAEMMLLGELDNGDEALSHIWTLWFHERGEKAASVLLKAEELTDDGPRSWKQAEDLLKELIETHGVYWAEPVNRLATLYYKQGKLKESEALCKTVLAVKPWHFGALSGIVMVYAAMHAVVEARHYAALRLPTFAPIGTNRRRREWVLRAISNAVEALLTAEHRLQDGFGKKDEHVVNKKKFSSFEEDAWQ